MKASVVAEFIRTNSTMSAAALSAATGIKPQRLYNIMNMRVTSVTSEEWDAIRATVLPGNQIGTPVSGLPMRALSVVGSASSGLGENDHPDTYDVYVPAAMVEPDSVGWQVVGDSMMPWLEPGDVIVAKPHRVPRLGYPMLVRHSDGSVSVKIIAHEGGGFVLRSLNATYSDRPADVEYLGYVTGRYRSVGAYMLTESEPSGLRP